MTYKLFIDDERDPVESGWMLARSSDEAIKLLEVFGCPKEIAFDHDLGGDDTAMKFCWALFEYMDTCEEVFPKAFKYSVHSQNPVGAENIRHFMNNLAAFLEHLYGEEV